MTLEERHNDVSNELSALRGRLSSLNEEIDEITTCIGGSGYSVEVTEV